MNMKENRFSGLPFEAARKLYRELLMKHHPDHGGDEEETKKIVGEFEIYVATKVDRAACEFEEKYEYAYNFRDELKEIIMKIIGLENVRIEIIGVWVYVFDSFEVKEYLASIGFWFSAKHRAWVYSGSPKKRYHTKFTTDQLRRRHGSVVVENEVKEKIAQ